MTVDIIIGPLAIMTVSTVSILWTFLVGDMNFYRSDIRNIIEHIVVGAIVALCVGIRFLLSELPSPGMIVSLLGGVIFFVQAFLSSTQLTMFMDLAEYGPSWRNPGIVEYGIKLLIFTVIFLVTVGLLHWSFYVVFGGILIGVGLWMYLLMIKGLVNRINKPISLRLLVQLSVTAILNVGLGVFLFQA